MSIKEELIDDIKLLHEHTLQDISVIVKEIVTLNFRTEAPLRPVYEPGKRQMWIPDDFDEPLEELKVYVL